MYHIHPATHEKTQRIGSRAKRVTKCHVPQKEGRHCFLLPRESIRVAWDPAYRRDGRLSCGFIASRGTGTLTSGGWGTSTVESSATCSGIVTSNVPPIVTEEVSSTKLFAEQETGHTVCHDWVYH